MHAQFSNSLDVLLEVRAEQLSLHELAALRAVCAQLKQQVCEAVRSLHAAELAKILQCTTTFPAVEEVRLVEIDFTEWAAHCAERLAHRVATHILWLRNEPNHRFVDRANALTCWQTLLVSRLLGVQPLELGLSDDVTMPGLPGSNVDDGVRRLDKPVADEIKLIGDTLKEQVIDKSVLGV